MMKWTPPFLSALLLAGLGFLSVGYFALGCYCLLADTDWSYPCDLRLRWVEQRLVYQRLNPQEHGHPDPDLYTSAKVMRHNGRMKDRGSGYPPWAYALNMLFVPPLDWQATRWYYFAINVLAVVTIGVWAYRLGREHGRLVAALAVVAVLAMFPFAICWSYGQLAILAFACVVGYYRCLQNGRGWLAGLFLALALAKPTLGALFAIPTLVRREARPVLMAGVILLSATGLVSWWLGRPPWAMVAAFLEEARGFAFLSHNPVVLASQRLVGFRLGTFLTASLGLAIGVALCVRFRHDRSLLNSFAVCAILAMLWSYRRHYDCVLLGIPMVGLLLLAVRTRSVAVAGIFLAFGASLWIPLREEQWQVPVVQYSQTAIWLVALSALAWSPVRRDSSPGAPGVDPGKG